MTPFRIGRRVFLPTLLVVALTCLIRPSVAGDNVPFTARSAVDLAHDAALAWAPDARLVYVENDESVAPTGTAARWGYLFYSERKGKARGYTVRNDKILEATDLGFDFPAPPLPDTWVDSGVALSAADRKAGAKYRTEHGGRLSTAMLIRGAFDVNDPDATTWAFVYTSDTEPALIVVVDAIQGNVIRTMRG